MTILPIWIFVAITLIGFAFEAVLELINLQYRKTKLPPILSDVYNDEAYNKQQNYELVTTRFSLVKNILSTFLFALLLLYGFFGWLHSFVLQLNYVPVFTSLIFFCNYSPTPKLGYFSFYFQIG